MSADQASVLHGLVFPSGSFISQFTSSSCNVNAEELTGQASGHPQPLFTGIAGERPECVFSSPQVGTVLTALGLFGTDLSAGNTDAYLKAATDLGTRVADATTLHHRLRMAAAYGYVRRIRAAQGQSAEIEARIVPTFDGSTVPLIPAGSVALAGTASGVEHYTLGPVKVNGSFLTGVQEWDLDFGCVVEEIPADGDLYTSFCYLADIIPVITVRGLSSGWQASFGTVGTALSALTLFLRKRSADGGNISDATASHVAITATNGLIRFENVSGAGNKPTSTGLRIRPRASSSSANVLAASTSSAIS